MWAAGGVLAPVVYPVHSDRVILGLSNDTHMCHAPYALVNWSCCGRDIDYVANGRNSEYDTGNSRGSVRTVMARSGLLMPVLVVEEAVQGNAYARNVARYTYTTMNVMAAVHALLNGALL